MTRLIVFSLLSIVLCPISAKQPSQPTISVERQQQFTYYWYAAKQAILDERYADALVLLEFCEQINPKDGETLEALGVIYNALNQGERALELWKRAFEADPRDQWYHYSTALLELRTEAERKEALRVLEEARKMQPKDHVNDELLEQLQRLYMSEGKYQKAIAVQDDIDRQKGYDVYSAYHRLRAYAFWNKPKKALAEIDKYLEQEPSNLQFLLYRIEFMQRLKAKPTELYAQYEQILEYAPNNLSILNNYAYLLATQGGDLKKAERMSRLTIREEPDNPVFLDTYGWILFLQGEKQLALFYLEKALSNSNEQTRGEVELHLKIVKSEK